MAIQSCVTHSTYREKTGSCSYTGYSHMKSKLEMTKADTNNGS